MLTDADAVDLAAAVLEHDADANRGKSNVDGKYESHVVASMGNEPIA